MRIESGYIFLKDLRFHAFHGVMPQERKVGGDFLVSLRMGYDISKAMRTDEVSDTLNYAEVYATVKAIVEGEPCQLIETVGERVATAVLQGYAKVQKVRVTVHKPQAPLPGKFGDAAISVVRTRA